MKTCNIKKKDGQRCGASARPDTGHCLFHSPEYRDNCRKGRRLGGIERSKKLAVLPPETPDKPLKTIADVTAMLAITTNQVRRGEIDSRIATTVGYLCGLLLKSVEQGVLEQRILALEAVLTTKFDSNRISK